MDTRNSNKQEERTEARNITLYPTEWRIVESYADFLFNGNTSAALRMIVRQWAAQQVQAEMPAVSPVQS